MSNTEDNIKKELQITENIYRQTQSVIDDLASGGEGKRMEIKNMADVVGLAVGMAPKDVLHMVNRYAHNAIGGYVRRGKKGGFITGSRPVKVEKTLKIDSTDSK